MTFLLGEKPYKDLFIYRPREENGLRAVQIKTLKVDFFPLSVKGPRVSLIETVGTCLYWNVQMMAFI